MNDKIKQPLNFKKLLLFIFVITVTLGVALSVVLIANQRKESGEQPEPTTLDSTRVFFLENASKKDRIEKLLSITLYEDGTAQLSAPLISSYLLPPCIFSIRDNDLSIYPVINTDREREFYGLSSGDVLATFSFINEDTLVFKATSVPLYADAGARYVYTPPWMFFDGDKLVIYAENIPYLEVFYVAEGMPSEWTITDRKEIAGFAQRVEALTFEKVLFPEGSSPGDTDAEEAYLIRTSFGAFMFEFGTYSDGLDYFRIGNDWYLIKYPTGPFNIFDNSVDLSSPDIIEPGRLEDISFSVESPYMLRRSITDMDNWFVMNIENQTDKDYVATDAILERRTGNDWAINGSFSVITSTTIGDEGSAIYTAFEISDTEDWKVVNYGHANLGMILRSVSNNSFLYLNEPLKAGDYRITLVMNVWNSVDTIEPSYEFTVIKHSDLLPLQWDMSQLYPSSFNEVEQSTGLTMSITNPVLDADNPTLDLLITANDKFNFGTPYEINVLLDGRWYSVPLIQIWWDLTGIILNPDIGATEHVQLVAPLHSAGILPAGQYRIVKEFTRFDFSHGYIIPNSPTSNEFAIVEFSVPELLEWHGPDINIWD